MILSMTGFGKGISESSTRKITAEVKSLNSKQLDFFMRVPPYYRAYEIEARNDVASALERGKVEMIVTAEAVAGQSSVKINIENLRGYKEQVEQLSRELGLPQPADWYSVLMRMPDALQTASEEASEDDKEAFMAAVKTAVDALTDFRKAEGRKLYGFFVKKIENIGNLLKEVDPYEEERVPKIKARLEEQLAQIHGVNYDAGRLEQELIFYIEKLDVNEEKLRLRSHLDYFLETLGGENDERPAAGQGKKLGFIAQEMGREINTLGSKSNNAGMQKIVVRMKDELEQIKEQVLNVL